MKYRLALIGYGGVARALTEIIRDHGEAFAKDHELELSVVAVSDMRLGSVVNADGLNINDLAAIPSDPGALSDLSGGSSDADNETIIRNSNADIVVEATFTNPKTGEPALSHINWAREAGKHLITTNKGPVALKSAHLSYIARREKKGFEFEGVVMSGTPVIRFAQTCLKGCTIEGFKGILNGTANYVLGLIEDGATLQEAVKKAQDLGYAEADPTADIGGSDVLMKVLILSNQLLKHDVDMEQLVYQGIESLNEEDIRAAKAEGYRWKLIGEGKIDENGTPQVLVGPVKLSAADALAGVSGATNAVTFTTDFLGDVTVTGPGAGRIETGFALLSDIFAIHEKSKRPRLFPAHGLVQ